MKRNTYQELHQKLQFLVCENTEQIAPSFLPSYEELIKKTCQLYQLRLVSEREFFQLKESFLSSLDELASYCVERGEVDTLDRRVLSLLEEPYSVPLSRSQRFKKRFLKETPIIKEETRSGKKPFLLTRMVLFLDSYLFPIPSSLKEEAWYAPLCNAANHIVFFGVVYRLVAFLYYFITLNPILIPANPIVDVLSTCVFFFFFMLSSDISFYHPTKQKKQLFFMHLVRFEMVLVSPFLLAIARGSLPYLAFIPISTYFSPAMVLNLGRLLSLIPFGIVYLLHHWILTPILSSVEFERWISAFRLSQVYDMRENKDTAYDLRIFESSEDKDVLYMIAENDRLLATTVTGSTGTGKSASSARSVNEDFNRKVSNNNSLSIYLLKMVQEKKAFYRVPPGENRSVFKSSYVIPYPKYEKQYYALLKRYRNAGVVFLSPDASQADMIMDLAISKGLVPQFVDPTLFNQPERRIKYEAYRKGFSPFFVPYNLYHNKDYMMQEASFVMEAADSFADVLEKIDESKGGKSDRFFTSVNRSITVTVSLICMLYCMHKENRCATFEDFSLLIDDFSKLADKIVEIESVFGRSGLSINKDYSPRSKESLPIIQTSLYENPDTYAYSPADLGSYSKSPLKETPWRKTILYCYNNILNPAKAMAINEWATGLRNIVRDFGSNMSIVQLMQMKNTLDFDACLANGDIVVVNYASEMGELASKGVGLFFQYNLQAAISRRDIASRRPLPLIFEYVDELSLIISPKWIGDAYERNRKYQVALTTYIQSYSQFEKSEDSKYLGKVLQGAGTQMVFSRASTFDMDLFSKLSGKKEVEEVRYGTSQTSVFDDSPSFTSSQMVTRKEVEGVSQSDIRMGQGFLSFYVFTVCNGEVKFPFNVRVSFLDKREFTHPSVTVNELDWESISNSYVPSVEDEAFYQTLYNTQKSLEQKDSQLMLSQELTDAIEDASQTTVVVSPIASSVKSESVESKPFSIAEAMGGLPASSPASKKEDDPVPSHAPTTTPNEVLPNEVVPNEVVPNEVVPSEVVPKKPLSFGDSDYAFDDDDDIEGDTPSFTVEELFKKLQQ